MCDSGPKTWDQAASGKVRPLGSPGLPPTPGWSPGRPVPGQPRPPAQGSLRRIPALGAVGAGLALGSKAGTAHLGDDHGRPQQGPGTAKAGRERQSPGGGDRGFPDCPPRRAPEEMTAREPGRARREGRRPE